MIRRNGKRRSKVEEEVKKRKTYFQKKGGIKPTLEKCGTGEDIYPLKER